MRCGCSSGCSSCSSAGVHRRSPETLTCASALLWTLADSGFRPLNPRVRGSSPWRRTSFTWPFCISFTIAGGDFWLQFVTATRPRPVRDPASLPCLPAGSVADPPARSGWQPACTPTRRSLQSPPLEMLSWRRTGPLVRGLGIQCPGAHTPDNRSRRRSRAGHSPGPPSDFRRTAPPAAKTASQSLGVHRRRLPLCRTECASCAACADVI